jgi:site-specific DNA-adenine methylase
MAGPLFWYAGGKRRTAAYVWRALGDVTTYAEPFCGSAAVFFGRPAWHLASGHQHYEILNDRSGRLVNLYRAIRDDPAAVWQHAQGPRAELDLDARLAAVNADAAGLDERLRGDPGWHDARLAAWQLYLLRYTLHPRIAMGAAGRTGPPNRDAATLTQQDIRDAAVRLRTGNVTLLCGDWARAARVVRYKPAGVFLDPPYPSPDWQDDLYGGTPDREAGAAARAWATEHGPDPAYRIVLAGFDGEGRPPGWTEVYWASKSGGASRFKERLWLSPHCLVVAADPGRPLNLQARQVRP